MSRPADADADVIVVGAGPSGATAAYHLARAGLSVLLLEKTAFPREKVCGDGLTPRATAQLIRLGIDISEDAGWLHNKGLRIYGGGMRLHLEWPELGDYPGYGLVRTRLDLDEQLARHAQKAGAQLYERCTVTGPVTDEQTGRIVGVTARHEGGSEVTYRSRVVIAADGNSSRLAIARGLQRQDKRPMGVAVRTYFTSPRHPRRLARVLARTLGRQAQRGRPDARLRVDLRYGRRHLERRPRHPQHLECVRPGGLQGPAPPVARPRAAGVAVRPPSSRSGRSAVPHCRWGSTASPTTTAGCVLVGDAGGMVNPFNGEGIAYGMQSGEIAADVIASALARDNAAAQEMALARYPQLMAEALGGYYTLGGVFVKLIGNPKVMQIATRHGLPRPLLMKFTLKLLANLYEPRGGDAADRLISALTKLVPAA